MIEALGAHALTLLAMLICGAAVVGSVFLMAKRIGAQAAVQDQARKTLETVETRNAVERDVAREPDPAGRLRQRWSRD